MLDVKKITGLIVAAALLLGAPLALATMTPRQIYKTKAPGVVLLVASEKNSSSASAGTGSIIRSDGTIITNCHVVFNPKTDSPFESVHVFLKPKRVTGDMNKDLSRHFTGKVIAYDKNLDLALIKMMKPPANLTVITLGNPGQLGPGDETIAIGHPEQGGLWTITRGVIGAEIDNFKGIQGKDVFQMDTSLNRGNSGGPLFDIRGYQVGVNTAIARKGANGIAITGVNFALKASVVKKWAASQKVLLAYGTEPLQPETQVALAQNTAKPKADDKTPEIKATTKQDSSKPATQTQVFSDPSGHGSITMEGSSPDEEGEEYVSRKTTNNSAPSVKTTRKTTKSRRPIRFHRYYRTPPRPFTFHRLLSAVDKVRVNAQDAFDDLERAMRKRGH